MIYLALVNVYYMYAFTIMQMCVVTWVQFHATDAYPRALSSDEKIWLYPVVPLSFTEMLMCKPLSRTRSALQQRKWGQSLVTLCKYNEQNRGVCNESETHATTKTNALSSLLSCTKILNFLVWVSRGILWPPFHKEPYKLCGSTRATIPRRLSYCCRNCPEYSLWAK